MRLDRYLSEAGVTRSAARAAIVQGRVVVEGLGVRDSAAQVVDGARVTLDGAVVGLAGPLHVMLYKPSGVVTAASDGRFGTVFDCLPAHLTHRDLCAVGRLDRDTTGLLLLTTDGQLAHRLISPRFAVEKVYCATVEGELTPDHVRRMAEGVPLKDFTARPAQLTILAPNVGELTVTEGKYHQVKRMFGALGCPVTALHRRLVGGIPLDEFLLPGQARALIAAEIAQLYRITQMEGP